MLFLLLVAINAQKCLNTAEFAVLRSETPVSGDFSFDFETFE